VNDFVAQRLRELEAFERRASGIPFTAASAAPVAQQGDFVMSSLSVFQPASNKSAFLKMGIMGKQGAGKTKTAGKVAIGLVQHLKNLGISYASKPVGFFDTETGSDYLIPDFEAAGIPFVVAKTKTLADLVKAMDEAEANCSVLIIDSITHPYREMVAAYLKTKKRTFLQIDDYQYLQGDYGWAMFTNRFINSKLHIIMCGRAGDDLEQYTDEQGKRQLEKIGVKMKGHSETGFEPSLLIEMKLMERNNREQTGRKRTFVNMATVVKDRWDQINGDEIDNPEFGDFLPHIKLLALGGEHVGVRDTGDSQSILKTEPRDWQPVQRRIVIDETKDLLVLHVPGQTAIEKQRKVTLLHTHFNASWVEIEEAMPLINLRAGYDSLHRELEGKPSKYGAVIEADAKPIEMNDSLPDFVALKDITPSPELLASRIVVEAAQEIAATKAIDVTTLANNGMPAFLDRREKPDVAALSIDEAKWLADLTRDFGQCVDLMSLAKLQQSLMEPFRSVVTAPSWKKAKALSVRCMERLIDASSASFAAAAE
jgi:AAA domain